MKLWRYGPPALSAAVVLLLAACGGGGSVSPGSSFDFSNSPGSLVATPSTLTTLTPAQFQAAAPASLFQVAGAPKCTIAFNYFQYGTVGGAGETTTASGGIMVPSGADPACQGARPVLLYAHGTTTDKNYNMASPQNSETALIAAMYAAQGYIVVAPNYAGYESSPLPYHPYLNAEQQSKDMVDALTAARKSFADLGATANSKLFVSGYSQGGHVAMATVRALQLAGTPVTAAAPMSGPYNLSVFGDAVFAGNVNIGATVFSPLLTTSYQRAYGNIYAKPNDIYEDNFATGIESLLPSTTSLTGLITAGKLPAAFMFDSTPPAPPFAAVTPPSPSFAPFFGKPNLVKNSYRLAYLTDAQANPNTPQNALRAASVRNDLLKLNWVPTKPMLLCGGNADPTVFFFNTQNAKTYFTSKGVPDPAVTVLDVDSAPTGATDPFALAKGGFAQAKAAAAAGGATAVAQAYHGSLVPPFCNAAARGYFSQF
jgi:acetyl esterase/lipase